LLLRGTGKLELTQTGEMVLLRARSLLAEQHSLLEDLAKLNAGAEAVTYVNGSPMTAVALIPLILARMSAEHPHFRISLRGDCGANYEWKRESVAAGELDVALTLFDPELKDESLEQKVLFEPVLKVVVRKDHPAFSKQTALSHLLPFRWIFPP